MVVLPAELDPLVVIEMHLLVLGDVSGLNNIIELSLHLRGHDVVLTDAIVNSLDHNLLISDILLFDLDGGLNCILEDIVAVLEGHPLLAGHELVDHLGYFVLVDGPSQEHFDVVLTD